MKNKDDLGSEDPQSVDGAFGKDCPPCRWILWGSSDGLTSTDKVKKIQILILILGLIIQVIFYHIFPSPIRADERKNLIKANSGISEEISSMTCQLMARKPNHFDREPSIGDRENTLFLVQRAVSFAQCGFQNLGIDDGLWGDPAKSEDGNNLINHQKLTTNNKQPLLTSIDYSLQYLQTDAAVKAYQNYRISDITRDRVWRSLVRFRQLLLSSRSPAELESAVKREFRFYQSVGKDKEGTVLFTAYYEPLYPASPIPTGEYRYPLYRRPPNLSSWPKPHPTRAELEGEDGLQGSKGKLRGLELFWLRDRIEAYTIHIQGSARLVLPDGKQTSVNYDGNTAYSYSSIGRALADDGKLPLEGMTMPIILDYFHKHPAELNVYIPRDRSFVFFKESHGNPAMGSINVPVTAERSIATDKSLMPPGALALIHAAFPFVNSSGQIEHRTVSRYVLDQDTGGAIKGPGRVDYFVGTGEEAGIRSGVTVSNGQLYYLLLPQ
ncbi:MAG TPA: murein transglycosylase [Cyanobacteria bacterium UBA11149]|nr:murein transglycosylase [Cyanobacteria bacterium UBA11367]HBE60103.1 murein transglycosylase [Cyanobacteria bacterium UBA11366]HBK62678.1 murein transglycosylase [Cyanobacteria bacterium UBA11166]HBR73212.1 murein transglycosylase [Cyanobacteria bacterium UBA11159]HBS71633.1 murein transglycosylase [Cyanobacteria bacterium UBA11153]HBW90809.1 murein transglycosylase [Cyanobacteria bacterium UBA11149]HCA97717.1 murein transglycosylase [Cyanobacteria bacterium UBA9226]